MVVCFKRWTSKLLNKTVVLPNNSAMAVAVFQARRGRDPFILVWAREIWWTCTVDDIALSMVHTRGVQLTDSVNALS